jgi:apolipoprotein D and lipocalin family protein
MSRTTIALCAAAAFSLCACATADKTPMLTVSHVDLPRFMGPWYVLASIPTFLEKGAYNAVESYALNPDGTIATTFTYHKGAFDGPLKTMKPRGFVKDSSNALWGMQFLWPIKAEYRIAYLDDAYSKVVIARSARDYVWIMARTPEIPAGDYQHLVDVVKGLGYDVEKLQKVPQRWP